MQFSMDGLPFRSRRRRHPNREFRGLLILGSSSVPHQLGGCGCGLRAGWAWGLGLAMYLSRPVTEFWSQVSNHPCILPASAADQVHSCFCVSCSFCSHDQPELCRLSIQAFVAQLFKSELPLGYPGGVQPFRRSARGLLFLRVHSLLKSSSTLADVRLS